MVEGTNSKRADLRPAEEVRFRGRKIMRRIGLTILALASLAAIAAWAEEPKPSDQGATGHEAGSIRGDNPPVAKQPQADDDDNPFSNPGVNSRQVGPPPKNEGIRAKIRRLNGTVTLDVQHGKLIVRHFGHDLPDAEVDALCALGDFRSVEWSGSAISDRAIARLVTDNREIRCLDLSTDTKITNEALKAVAKLPKLRTLNLAETHVSDLGVAALKGHPALRELCLANTKVGNAGIQSLSENADLTRLDIGNTQTDSGAMPYVAKLHRLQVLCVDLTVSNHALADIEGLTELREFGRIMEISDEGLYHLRKMRHLRVINCGMHRVTDNGLREIAPLTELAELRLGRSQITDEGMKVIARLPGLSALFIGETKITDVGIRQLRSLTGLQVLNCDSVRITDAAMQDIGALRQLRALSVARTEVTDAGMDRLTNLDSLCELDLSGTRVGNAGMVAVGKLRRLQDLTLTGTRVDDGGLQPLAKMAAIKRVDLCHTKVSRAGVSLLERRYVVVDYSSP